MQERLAALRRYQNISQKKMAELIGIDLRTYINKEKGVSQFKADEMFRIAQVLQMQIGDIFLPPDYMKHETDTKTKPKPYSVAGGDMANEN